AGRREPTPAPGAVCRGHGRLDQVRVAGGADLLLGPGLPARREPAAAGVLGAHRAPTTRDAGVRGRPFADGPPRPGQLLLAVPVAAGPLDRPAPNPCGPLAFLRPGQPVRPRPCGAAPPRAALLHRPQLPRAAARPAAGGSEPAPEACAAEAL